MYMIKTANNTCSVADTAECETGTEPGSGTAGKPIKTTVAVIGGGAAGLVAAATAAESGARVLLFEKNRVLGCKLRITGKGRCNVTNDCTVQAFMSNVPGNPRFLWSALDHMSPADTMEMFEHLGVPLKTERGSRVFPVSDRAGDIAGALVRRCHAAGVEVIQKKVRKTAPICNHKFEIYTDDDKYICESVIICTGGMSYPKTGSDGDGYRMARELGHTVTPLSPSLVPIVCDGDDCRRMQGLSLKNVGLRILPASGGKAVYEDFGEMMFTHFGLSGPMILSASAHLPDIKPGKYVAHIDLKPALDHNRLDARLISDFSKYSNRDFINALGDLLPQKMIETVVLHSAIPPHQKVNNITREQRRGVVELLKDFTVKLSHFRPIDEAIVTRGGVCVREIRPGTMESKIVPGVYFAGEIIDVDAYTGGFNLQIAFSTGALAGYSAATSQI